MFLFHGFLKQVLFSLDLHGVILCGEVLLIFYIVLSSRFSCRSMVQARRLWCLRHGCVKKYKTGAGYGNGHFMSVSFITRAKVVFGKMRLQVFQQIDGSSTLLSLSWNSTWNIII